MKRSGLSIRYKILGLLTVIPLVTLAIYLFLAIRIFEEDKIAYVFDSSSNLTGAMSAQIKTELTGKISVLKPLFQDFLNSQKFGEISESILKNEFGLEAIIVYRGTGSSSKVDQVDFIEKTTDLVKNLNLSLPSHLIQKLQAEAVKQGRLIRAPFGDDRLVVFEKVTNDKNPEEFTLFAILLRLPEVFEPLSAESVNKKILLVSSTGDVLFGPKVDRGLFLKDILPVKFLSQQNQGISQGAETVKKGSADYLVSFSKVGFGDLFVISSVPRQGALSATKVLMRKSLMFFAILICVTVIVSLISSSRLTRSLTALFEATNRVSHGEFGIQVKVNSNDEVGALADNFNIMAIEVARLLEQTAEKARMEAELQTAKTVQETLMPEVSAKMGGISIHGFYEPASECGGDWWHYCQIGKKVFFWIGDATGHGAPAALITSAAKSASAVIERLDVTPCIAMEIMNQCIYDVSKGRIMMTFFIASFDSTTGEFSYSNASHEPPFLIKKSAQELKRKDLQILNEVTSPRLGQDRMTTFTEATVFLDPGDLIFFYTDGITDIRNKKEDGWGEREFLKALIKSNKDSPEPAEVVSRFVSSFESFRSGTSLIDDVTFFVAKYEGALVTATTLDEPQSA